MGDKYGESDINASKVAVIDFSSPNIAKPMGVRSKDRQSLAKLFQISTVRPVILLLMTTTWATGEPNSANYYSLIKIGVTNKRLLKIQSGN